MSSQDIVAVADGQFRRYGHLERFGHPEVRDIEHGKVHVFPKLDGTNASVWLDLTGAVQCGSRNRVLSVASDNQGFCAWVHSDDPKAVDLRAILGGRPNLVIYGEWLVPHTIKSYREDAWRRFWVFDVWSRESQRYVPYEDYVTWLEGQDIVPPLCTITDPSTEQLVAQCETNTFLVANGAGVGEGVVLKRYDWQNDYGRQTWAKIVRNEFKEANQLAFGVTEKSGEFQVEVAIAEQFCTATLVGKTRAKVVADVANHFGVDLTQPNAQRDVEYIHRRNVIPQLLGRVWHDFIQEEIWSALKEHGNPTIDFKKLHSRVVSLVKVCAQDLFGSGVKP